MEDKPLPFVGIDRLPLGFLEKLFGKREIAPLQQPEEGVLLPFRSVEAPVGLGAFRPGRRGGCEVPTSAPRCRSRSRPLLAISSGPNWRPPSLRGPDPPLIGQRASREPA